MRTFKKIAASTPSVVKCDDFPAVPNFESSSVIIGAISTTLGPHLYTQEELLEGFSSLWQTKHVNSERVAQLHRAVGVGQRALALPKEEYLKCSSFTERNNAFMRVGTELGIQVVRAALQQVDLTPQDVGLILFTTVTGVSVPTIDARVVNALGMQRHVKRLPIFGLGCVGGAAGLARLHDYLQAYPEQIAVLLSVELCSLTLQPDDLSVANTIAAGLFGDGAAAVVAVGEKHPLAKHLQGTLKSTATASFFYPNTERVMGWDIGEKGFKVILDAAVPTMARDHLGKDLLQFLTAQGLSVPDITSWICHPGGPKVLEGVAEGLKLPPEALQLSWDTLASVGNISSASVLFVMDAHRRKKPGKAGELALIAAMGPGFCSEVVLCQWH